jgi:hypothetical protein
MMAHIQQPVLLVNSDNWTTLDFGPASVPLERMPHPWQRPELNLPDWYVLLDTGLGRPVTWWETDARVRLVGEERGEGAI